MLGIRVDEDVSLRLHSDRHAQELFEVANQNREHLRGWLPWVDATTSAEDTRRYIREMLRGLAEGREYGFDILVRGQLDGSIGMRVIPRISEAEVGYWISASMQGQGIITRATRALIRFAFDDLGMNRLVIKCAVDNDRSRAVPERLGFKQEATHRQRDVVAGRARDEVVYAILRSEWEG